MACLILFSFVSSFLRFPVLLCHSHWHLASCFWVPLVLASSQTLSERESLAISCAHNPNLGVHLELDILLFHVDAWPCGTLLPSFNNSHPTKGRVDGTSHQDGRFKMNRVIRKEG